MPTVSDYGGKHYGGPAGVVTKCSEKQDSFRCLDCGTLRYVNRREWYRASRPRCLKCGGALDDTDATIKKVRGTIKPPPPLSVPRRRCEGCGKAIDSHKEMIAHLSPDSECRRLYSCEQKTLPIPPFGFSRIIASTVIVEKGVTLKRSQPWGVFGITSLGQYVCMFQSHRKMDCDKYVREHFGDVHLAR